MSGFTKQCPRCKANLVTRNGEGTVVATLELVEVPDEGRVCTCCAQALAYNGAPRRALIKTMRPQRVVDGLKDKS